MSTYYKIIKTSVKKYPYIVFATSYINPMEHKESIENDFRILGMKGKVLFDLLLSHGNTSDRFFEAFFDGKEINEDSLKNVEKITNKIKEISSQFYTSGGHSLENSVLTKAQKYLIKKNGSL